MVNTRGNGDIKQNNLDNIPVKEMFAREIKNIIEEELKHQFSALLNEIVTLKKEVTILKETNIDLINLLTKSSNEQTSNTKIPNVSNPNLLFMTNSSTETVTQVQTTKNQKPRANKKNHHKQMPASETTSNKVQNIEDKQESTNKNKKNTIVVGTNTFGSEKDEFGSGESLLWLYVGRCRQGTTAESIKSYMQKRSPGYSFEVTELDGAGRNKSFKVGANISLKDELYNSDYWPNGIVVKRFRFRKSNNGNFSFSARKNI